MPLGFYCESTDSELTFQLSHLFIVYLCMQEIFRSFLNLYF